MGDRPDGPRPVPTDPWRWFAQLSVAAAPAPTPRPTTTPALRPTATPKPHPPITIDSRQLLLGAAGLAWLQHSAAQFREQVDTYIADDFETQLREHPTDAARIAQGWLTRVGLRLFADGLPRPRDITLDDGQYRVAFPAGGLAVAISELPEPFVTAFVPGRYGFRGALDLDTTVSFRVRITRRGSASLSIDITQIDGVALRAWDVSSTRFLYDVHLDIDRGRPCVRVHYEPDTPFPPHCWDADAAWHVSARELASATRMIATTQRVLETATDIFTGRWLDRFGPKAEPIQ